MAWTCPSCDAHNKPRAVECEQCGTERPVKLTPKGQLPAACWFDQARLDAQGFCLIGQGFPVGILCPFVCPICRQRLEWSGACFGCHGSQTPSDRATWSFPGARFETFDDNGNPLGAGQHWMKVSDAGRRACTLAENAAGFAKVRRLLAGMAVDEA